MMRGALLLSLFMVTLLGTARADGLDPTRPFGENATIQTLGELAAQSGQRDGIPYVFLPSGLALLGQQQEWVVSCRDHGCRARQRGVWLNLDAGGLRLGIGAGIDARVTALNSNTSRRLTTTIAHPLNPVERAVLASADQILFEAGGSLLWQGDGPTLAVVLAYLEWATGHQGPLTDPPPYLGARALADQAERSARTRLIPFTKPQVQFAIRAQGGLPLER